ncbi:MAG: hypothetical protein RLZZ528_1987 [Pseudomonadota bacterium]
MNKAITDGLILMPAPFSAGLAVWSSGDGTPGSPTYLGAPNAAFVPGDQDFAGCLEVVKQATTTQLRYMGQTPILPGCYLRIRARVKAMSGNLPAVRVAAWAGGAGNLAVPGQPLTGPAKTLTTYGQVETIEAIVGTGHRIGVDMTWDTTALYGHFGIDLTGANGGVVRIDDIEIEDVTSVFHRNMMDWVDVRDYGARGDGVTNDAVAFEAADAAAYASGRALMVSAGTYFLDADITVESSVRIEGQLVMPASRRLSLTRNFTLAAYADAFGGEEEGFKKAFQALLNFTDHDALDLGGRRIEVTAPLDMAAIVGNKPSFATRRVIRNGQFDVVAGPAWTPATVTSQASYSTANPTQLTGVANAANVPVGALVTGAGVGREVYVTAVNVAGGALTLSQPLYDAAGTQVYTFTRFRYALDFSGFAQLERMTLDGIDIQCNGIASGILLAPAGRTFALTDSFVTRPKDRGLTSIGSGCQGMLVDRCQFLSDEQSLRAQDRVSIALNVNANDVKLRENRIVRFRHFAVMNGNGHLIVGNHWFQGDEELAGVRLGGLVLTQTNVLTTVTGNYIDNCFIEWTNEYEADPDFANQFAFGGLTVTGNIFLASDVAPWFRFLVVKPYGTGHFLQGLNVSGNVFKVFGGNIDRVDDVDTSIAGLDKGAARNVRFEQNAFNNVTQITANPVWLTETRATAATTWTVSAAGWLPFDGWARNVDSLVAVGMITDASGGRRSDMPYVEVERGANKKDVTLNWAQASKGTARVLVRMDDPN